MTRLQPDQNGFLDLSQIQPGSGMGLEEAVSGRVAPSFEDAGTGDFGGTRRDYVPRDPVAETVAARSQIATGGVGVQPDARVNYAPMQAINGYAADFIGSVEQTWNSLGSGLASGVARAASTLSGGYLDLTGSQVPHDRRTAELLASDDPAERSAGMRLLEQERSVEEGGRAGFAFESRRLREDPQPGIDPESWSSFSGRSLAGTAPSALGMTSPIAGGAVLGLYGVNAYESAYDRYVERSIAQTGTFDPSTATGIGLATGAFEAAAEYLPIKFASKLGKRAVDLAIDAVVKGGSGAKLRAAEALATAMLGSSAVEGIEEGVTEVANTLLELMYDRDLQAEFESDPQSAMVDAVGRVASAFGQGALGGAMLGGFGIGRAAADAVSRTDAAGTGAAKQQGETLNQESGPAPVWYSKMREVVSAKMGGAMDANQLIATLKANGVKDEEIDYSGLRDLTGKVTREQVEETLAENAVQVTEKVLGTPEPIGHDMQGNPMYAYPDQSGDGDTKFSQYQAPGGENYRELLLTLPSRVGRAKTQLNFADYATERGYTRSQIDAAWRNESDAIYKEWREKALDYDRGVPDFRSSHFDQPNILAHVRFNDRADADGKRVLFIEEVQSDWHQKGRDEGYASKKTVYELRAELEKAKEETRERFAEAKRFAGENPGAKPSDDSDVSRQWAVLVSRHANAAARQGELENQLVEARKGIPDAPFKKTWHQLAMKRMIRWAAENGYDRVAWTTGEMQANRYDLAQYIDEIQWRKRDDGTIDFSAVKGERSVLNKTRLPPQELADHIGKEHAKRIIESESESGSISGSGLSIGGEGMRAFYDRMLVNDTNAIIKRWGGKVGLEQIGPVKAHVFDVSREMQNDALARGMTLFQKGKSTTPPGAATPVMEWNVDNVAKALSVTPEQSHAIVALANAMGLDPSRLRAQRGGERNATASPQGIKGQVEFTDAGDAIIRGVTSPDVSTGVHELSHVARRWLLDRNVPAAERAGITDTDIADAESWAGVGADGKWSVDAEEKLARGFEKYMRDGKAPVPRLQALFDRFRKWLLSIYQKLKGSPIDVRISPEMRRVFDSLVKRGSVAQAPLPDLYRAAVGEGYAETKPETPNRLARVARPDAIAALRAQGLWPTSTAPDDLTLELLTDPKFEPIVYLLSRKSDLSRTDATWLFGPENKEMGDKKTRAQWLEAFKGLAPPTAWNVPSFMTDLAPPTQPPAGGPQGAGGPDMVGLRKDFLTMRQRGWQDQFIQLFRLAQDVTPGQEFDAGSPVPVIRTVNSRIADETRRLNEERIAPLLERMKASGISGARVAEYLIARHVPEANEVAARRNPDNPAVASGMTDARAAAVVAKEERSKDFAEFDAIASEWRQILRDEFDASFDAGMMTEAEHAAMSQYWNYVPIMDDPEFLEAAGLASDESTLGPKKRLSVGRMQYVKRTGRTAESLDDPQSPRAKALFDGFLANVMTVAERRISRRLRNDFGNVLRRWVDDNPRAGDALTIVAEPPMVDMVVEGETQRVPDPNYRDQDNVLHFKAAEDFEAGGKKVRRGETFYIEVADPELGKILKSSSEVGDQGWKFLIGAMYMGTRATTLGATGPLALSFHVDNLIRDIAEVIGVAGAQKKAHGVRGHVYRQFRRNLVGAHMNLWGSRSNARMAGYREEWERLGGRMQMLGPVEFAKAKQRIDAALSDSTSAKVKNVAIALKNGIRVAVQPFELSTKLAYFASLRDNGVPAEKAAALTRDVMDYEKRGSATGPIRVAYAFTNPSIQGTERMISSLSGNPARMFQAAAFTAGIISALMSKWAIVEGWGDDEDEDGRPDWTQRLDYEKRMRFRIPFGAAGDALGIGNRVPDAIAVPVPYSQQLAHTLGAMLGEWTTGQRSTVNAAMAVAEAAADIYNPIGGSNIFEGPAAAAQALTPSIVRPMTDIAVNRNWFGGTIYNEPYPGQEVGWVDADNPRPSTAQSWVTLAQWMQRNVGIDLAPETIPYIIGSMFSTTGKDASQMFEIVSDSVDGDPTTDPLDRFPTKVPILRKFFVEGSNPAVLRQEYDSFRERAVRYENRLKDARARFDAVADDEEKRAAPLAEFRSTVNASDSAIAAEVRSAEAMIGKVRRHTRELRRALEDAVAQDDVETRRKIEAAIDRNRERMAIVMGHAVARMSGRSASASASGRTDRTSSREGSGRSTSATE